MQILNEKQHFNNMCSFEFVFTVYIAEFDCEYHIYCSDLLMSIGLMCIVSMDISINNYLYSALQQPSDIQSISHQRLNIKQHTINRINI